MKNLSLIYHCILGLALSTNTFAAGSNFSWNDSSPKDGSWNSNNWINNDIAKKSNAKPSNADTVSFTKSNGSYIIRGSTPSTTISNLNFFGASDLNLVFNQKFLVVTNTTNIATAPNASSTLMLSKGNFNLGSINIFKGNLALGESNSINANNTLNFSGPGALKMNGNAQTFSSLAITTPHSFGIIDMFSKATKSNSVRFNGDLSNIDTTSYLSVIRYKPGVDHIFFNSGLSEFKNNSIRINGMLTQYDSFSGEVTPLPEPSTYAAIIGSLVLAGTLIIRSRQKRATPTAQKQRV